MQNARLLRGNLITSSTMLSASAQRPGTVTAPQKTGAGPGSMAAYGNFTGAQRLDYKVNIDSSGAAGVATFQWSADGGATWTASLVITSSSDLTLNNGVKVRFEPSSVSASASFEKNDYWTFKAYRFYGVERLIDVDPNTDFRTCLAAATSGHEVDIDLGSSASSGSTPDALVVLNHNVSSLGVITLNGGSSSGFTAPSVTETVAWTSGPLKRYLTTAARSYRYWRLTVSDTGNSTGWIRLGELYLGSYDAPSKNMALGHLRPVTRMTSQVQMKSGDWTRDMHAEVREFSLLYYRLNACQRDLLVDSYRSLSDVVNRKVRPVLYDPDPDDTPIHLCNWKSPLDVQQEQDGPYWLVRLDLAEIPRSV